MNFHSIAELACSDNNVTGTAFQSMVSTPSAPATVPYDHLSGKAGISLTILPILNADEEVMKNHLLKNCCPKNIFIVSCSSSGILAYIYDCTVLFGVKEAKNLQVTKT